MSISPIFYKQLFHTKVFCTAFLSLQFGFVIFWQKDFGTKAAHKMLVKLTPGVNFTNIKQAAFSYQSFLRSLYVLTIWVCNFLVKGFWHKSCP
jgi:hypothetical protein